MIEIETQRLKLRPLTLDPDVAEYVSWLPHLAT